MNRLLIWDGALRVFRKTMSLTRPGFCWNTTRELDAGKRERQRRYVSPQRKFVKRCSFLAGRLIRANFRRQHAKVIAFFPPPFTFAHICAGDKGTTTKSKKGRRESFTDPFLPLLSLCMFRASVSFCTNRACACAKPALCQISCLM